VDSLRTHICIILLLIAVGGYSQNLIDDSRTDIVLSDGTPVTLFKAHSFEEPSSLYYYLPVNLHVASRDGNPEISLLLFDEQGDRGAILHFLLTWGLSDRQEKEISDILSMKTDDTVFIAGPLLVEAAPVSFRITGDDPLVEIMNEGLTQNSHAPIIPGMKLAASFRFSGEQVDYINEAIGEPGKNIDGTVSMIFIYRTMVREGYISKPLDHSWVLDMNLDNLFQSLRSR
jgi:hypothetical protein